MVEIQNNSRIYINETIVTVICKSTICKQLVCANMFLEVWPSASTPPADKLSFGDCYKEQAMAFLLVAQQSIDLTESNNTYYCKEVVLSSRQISLNPMYARTAVGRYPHETKSFEIVLGSPIAINWWQ